MKHIIPFVAAIVCFCAGCSKIFQGSGSMSVKINGEAIKFENCVIAESSAGGLQIEGYNGRGEGRGISLTIRNYVSGATGTYPVTVAPDLTVHGTLLSGGAGDISKSGTITITSSSSSAVSGTFSFTCENGIVYNITDGVFKAVD